MIINKKNLFVLGMCLIVLASEAQEKPFFIKGKIEGKHSGVIYLMYQDYVHNKFLEDSALIQNGAFVFKGMLDGVSEGYIMSGRNLGGSNMDFLPILLSPGNLELTIKNNKLGEAALLGTSVQEEMNCLNRSKMSLMEKFKKLQQAYQEAGNAYNIALSQKKDEKVLGKLKLAVKKARYDVDPIRFLLSEKDREFMDKYPASYVTASLLLKSLSKISYKQGFERYTKLSAEVKGSSLGKAVCAELEKLKMGTPGAMAKSFVSEELSGERLSLDDYKGKYVLLDFWASWCGPCRKGNPHLLSLYSKYKNKGFEIIGIADNDSSKEAWKKAVEEDAIGIWKHVLRGYRSEVDLSEYYGIHSLPTKILIDPEGMIIGRYGGGGENDEAMDEKLTEVFGF